MRPESWLDVLMGNVWRVRVLRALVADPRRVWTEREMARHLDAAHNTIHLAVGALLDARVLEFRRLGRSNTFRLRDDLALAHRLREIFETEHRTWDTVRQVIRRSTPPNVAVLLFGSTATGEAHEESDVDILVVAAEREDAVSAATMIREAVGTIIPLHLSIISLGRKDVEARRAEPWLQNAVRDGQLLSNTPIEAVA